MTEGKSSTEIIEQEIDAILNQWDSELMMVEREPLTQMRIYMNFNQNKMLDVQMIFPKHDASEPARDYPNSSLVVRLSSKMLPTKLVETLQKKSEVMIKKLTFGGQLQPGGESARSTTTKGKP